MALRATIGLSTHKSIVIAVTSDPDPRDCVVSQVSQRAVVVADPNAEEVGASFDPFEVQRRMLWILPL